MWTNPEERFVVSVGFEDAAKCDLTLEVWDDDHLGRGDFLGQVGAKKGQIERTCEGRGSTMPAANIRHQRCFAPTSLAYRNSCVDEACSDTAPADFLTRTSSSTVARESSLNPAPISSQIPFLCYSEAARAYVLEERMSCRSIIDRLDTLRYPSCVPRTDTPPRITRLHRFFCCPRFRCPRWSSWSTACRPGQ